MRLRHATPLCNVLSIIRRGLLTAYSHCKRVWLHERGKTQWAVQHVARRHGCKRHEVIVLEVEVPAGTLRRHGQGVFHCDRDIGPQALVRVVRGRHTGQRRGTFPPTDNPMEDRMSTNESPRDFLHEASAALSELQASDFTEPRAYALSRLAVAQQVQRVTGQLMKLGPLLPTVGRRAVGVPARRAHAPAGVAGRAARRTHA
jgi:hypothetical protein